jgi:hypothetical protein
MGRIILPRISIRHLLPPEPKIAVRLRPQYLHWQVGRYKERIVSGPGGLGRGRIWVPEKEAEQHNLVFTHIYDSLIPLYGFVGLARYAVVGSGSAAPDPSQTGLANEVARTDADTSPPLSWNYEPVNGRAVFTRVREFTEAQVGGRNLTEWGFSPVGTVGGNLMCRELFRDGSGNPVVLTLATDQRLRLIYEYSFSYTPPIGTAQDVSVNINGIGVKTAKLFLNRYHYSRSSLMEHVYLLDEWSRGYGIDINHAVLSAPVTLDPDDILPGKYSDELNLNTLGFTQITRGRKVNARTFGAADANRTWYGLMLMRGGRYGESGAVLLAFDPGQEFTKSSLYKMVVNEWVLTWGL